MNKQDVMKHREMQEKLIVNAIKLIKSRFYKAKTYSVLCEDDYIFLRDRESDFMQVLDYLEEHIGVII